MSKPQHRFYVSQHYPVDTQYRLIMDKHISPDAMTKPHWHPQVEINLPKNCDAQYYFVNKKVTVKAGQFAIFWGAFPHQLDTVTPYDDENEEIIYLAYVPLEIFMSYQLPWQLKKKVLNGEMLYQDMMLMDEQLFLQWLADCKRNPRSRQVSKEVEARLNRLKKCEYISAMHCNNSMRPLIYVRKIIEYISGNHQKQNLRISDIAKSLQAHPNYLMSIFKQVMAMTITTYINRYRLSHVCRQLVESNLTVKHIASNTGFGSMSHFYELFSFYMHSTPSQYRNRHQ